MKKYAKENFVLKKQLRNLLETEGVEEEIIRNFSLAGISLPDLQEKQKFSLNRIKEKIKYYLKCESLIFSHKELGKKVQVYVCKNYYIQIRMIWNNGIEKHNFMCNINSRGKEIYYKITKRAIDIRIDISRREVDLYYENENIKEKISINLYGNIDKDVMDLCIDEFMIEIPKIMENPNIARECFENAVIRIRTNTIQDKPFGHIRISQRSTIKGNNIFEEILYDSIKTLKVEAKIRKGKKFVIECTEDMRNKKIKWKIEYLSNITLKMEAEQVKFIIPKQKENFELINEIRELYKTQKNVIEFSEDFEKIRILLERKNLSRTLRKLVKKTEKEAKKIFYSKNVQL